MLRGLPLFACTTLLALGFTSLGRAAELRTTSGGRTIYRTASLQEEVLKPEPIDPVLAEDFVGPQACTACGVTGCDLGCIAPCRVYADFDYLLWWRKGRSFPALATTSPPGTSRADAGALGLATTTVLFGQDTLGEEVRPGGRITIGKWLDACETCGVEGRFWSLGQSTLSYSADSSQFETLARPSIDPPQQAILLAFVDPTSGPFTGPGSINISSESKVLGGDVSLRRSICQVGTTGLDMLGGYQYARIDEDLTVSSFTTAINVGGNVDPGTTFDSLESISTRNEFHAGQFGLSTTTRTCGVQVDLLAKVAFGRMRQVAALTGGTTVDDQQNPPALEDGPLVGSNNRDRFSRTEFAVAPELAAKLTYAVNECIAVTAGYNFIYWSDVLQPGDQIDANLTFPPPAYVFNSDSYWVHGFTCGVSCRF